mgnify:CR=1 FL=1
MTLTEFFIQILFHADEQLIEFIKIYGLWTYAILFAIIFVETGLVIMPFLPGDSLVFVAGALAASGSLNILALLILLVVAAVLGDSLNYSIGKFIGPKAFKKEQGIFFRRDYLEKTKIFYENHGPKTIIIARFMPFVRTFAPFVAGIGQMHYPKFLLYNVMGGIIWVGLFAIGGFLFGNIPIVKNNLTFVVIGIVVISLLPAVIKLVKKKLNKK